MSKPKIILVMENLRSIYNVGALLRTCEGLGVNQVVYIGTTPHPIVQDDQRLPFKAKQQTNQIAKTALGAENSVSGDYYRYSKDFLESRDQSKLLLTLEQNKKSVLLDGFCLSEDAYLVVGNEVDGVSKLLIEASDGVLEIPMLGHKESLNVEVAGAIAIYSLLH
ncbi:hypothetical protein KC878_04310 [Candidatus Saccharibacteria bacterium]|nr:hypothetical protein [Candidatus Saccharibacteria bacterium]MCB9821608.1 hypothetical protein [Candidatus Nomurabacteria bacterium]